MTNLRGNIIAVLLLLQAFTFSQSIKSDTLETFTKEVNSYSFAQYNQVTSHQIIGQNLGDILKNISSSFIKSNGPGGISTISLRGGSASQTQVFWEGIAINSPTLGQSDLSLLPAEFLQSITINYNGGSAHYSLGGIAGSVSMISSDGENNGGKVMFSKEIGSFGVDNISASFSIAKCSKIYAETILIQKSASNDFSYQDYSLLNNPVKRRVNGQFKQMGLQQNFIWNTNKGKYKFITNFTNTDRNIPAAIGSAVGQQSQSDRNFKSSIQYQISKRINQEDDTNRFKKHKINLGFVHDFLNYENLSSNINDQYFNYTFVGQFQSTYELKNRKKIDIDLSDYLYHAISDGFNQSIYQNRINGMLKISKKWENTEFNFVGQEVLIDNNISPFIFNLGAKQSFYSDHYLFGNVGMNYRYPTLNDLYWSVGGNTDLKPERSTNYELGIKGKFKGINSTIDYSSVQFTDWINNWIQWIPNENGIWSPENVKHVKKSGIESNLTLTKYFDTERYFIIFTSYRWVKVSVLESSVNNDEIGKNLIYTPDHICSIDAAIALKKLQIRYNQIITSKFYIDRLNDTYLPYSAPADFTIGYIYQENSKSNRSDVSLSFTIHNIWGEAYQIVANQPMPGRWYAVKLMYKLNNNSYGK